MLPSARCAEKSNVTGTMYWKNVLLSKNVMHALSVLEQVAMIETIVALLSKVPAPVLELVVDIVKEVAGAKTKREAALRAMKVAAKKAIRA